MADIKALARLELSATSNAPLSLKEEMIKNILIRASTSKKFSDKAFAKEVLEIAKKNNYKIPFEFDKEAQARAQAAKEMEAAKEKEAAEAKAESMRAMEKGIKELNQKLEISVLNAAREKAELEAKLLATNEAERKLSQDLEAANKAAETQKQVFEEQLVKAESMLKEESDILYKNLEAKLESITYAAAREKAELEAKFETKIANYIASISSKEKLGNTNDNDGYVDQIINFFKHVAEEEYNNSAPLKAIVAVVSKLKNMLSSDNDSIKTAEQLELKEQLINLNNKIIDIINSKPEYYSIFDALVKDTISSTTINEVCNGPENTFSNDDSGVCNLYRALTSDSDIISLRDNQDSATFYAARGELCLTEAFVQAPICAHFFDAH